MLGRDHALSGVVAFLAAAPHFAIHGAALADGAALCAGTAILCDIDEHGSTISRPAGS